MSLIYSQFLPLIEIVMHSHDGSVTVMNQALIEFFHGFLVLKRGGTGSTNFDLFQVNDI